jgi:RNA polymerase sigma factor (sigma-70 family)
MTDTELLDQYARGGDRTALGQLVQRHIDLVYSAARRHVGDPHLAEDVTQAVFILLAAKASRLRSEVVLSAWLLTATRYASKDALKMSQRRRRHEAVAAAMAGHDAARRDIADAREQAEMDEMIDQLDGALASLSQQDRRAVLLRYYEKQPFAQIGHALGVDEEAARKRVSRATGKLARFFNARGFAATSIIVAALLSHELVQSAPAALVARVTDVTAAAAAGTGIGATEAIVHQLVSAVQHRFFWSATRIAASYGMGLVLAMLACGWAANYGLSHPHTTPAPPPDQHASR